ncbi:hypothetical protein C8R43DRAFT_1141497 [Mycena crocata]|nr:hypothetical protein C8R43DRAFT_1141497 [Mycena crocata]
MSSVPIASTAPPSIKDGPAPFSGAPDPEDNLLPPDFILRCSDGCDLHVHRDILKFVSVFFRDLLSGNSDPNAMQKDGKPMLALPEESAQVLFRLLCIAYLCTTTSSQHRLWTASGKSMKRRRNIFSSGRSSSPGPCQKGGSRHIEVPNLPPDGVFPEMEHVTATTVRNLYQFHHSCGIAAQKLADDNAAPHDVTEDPIDPVVTLDANTGKGFVWWHPCLRDDGCGAYDISEPGRYGTKVPAQWFQNHIARIAPLLRALPTRGTVDAELLSVSAPDRALLNLCRDCSEKADHDLATFMQQLGTAIEDFNSDYGWSPVGAPTPLLISVTVTNAEGIMRF